MSTCLFIREMHHFGNRHDPGDPATPDAPSCTRPFRRVPFSTFSNFVLPPLPVVRREDVVVLPNSSSGHDDELENECSFLGKGRSVWYHIVQ